MVWLLYSIAYDYIYEYWMESVWGLLFSCEFTSGDELEGTLCKHPMYDRNSPILVGEHVTTESGTGLVHTAPGHGHDDFIVCKKYKIPVFCPG